VWVGCDEVVVNSADRDLGWGEEGGLGAFVWHQRGRRVLRGRRYARRTAIGLACGRCEGIVRQMGGKRRFGRSKGKRPGPRASGRGEALEGMERMSKVVSGRVRLCRLSKAWCFGSN
jgi:hypothetical protein